jgi:hypothetical protein
MRAASAFELPVTLSRGEHRVLMLIGAACAAVVGAWLWSHVDAAAGPAGYGRWPWFAAISGTAVLGAWLGWQAAPCRAGTLAWHQGVWTLSIGTPRDGHLQAQVDLGSWLLLRFDPTDGARPIWFGTDPVRAGAAWHPLRATLFAVGDGASQRGEGAPQ